MSKNLETGGEALGLVCSLGLLARKGPYKVLAVLLFATVAAMGCAGPLHAKPPLQGPEITLTIADAATGLPDSEGEADERVTMRVSADGTEEMAGIQFKVGFDSSVVQVATDGVVQGLTAPGDLVRVERRQHCGLCLHYHSQRYRGRRQQFDHSGYHLQPGR